MRKPRLIFQLVLITAILLSGCTAAKSTPQLPTAITVLPAITPMPQSKSTPPPTPTTAPAYPDCSGDLYTFNGSLPGKLIVDDLDHKQYSLIDLTQGSKKSIPEDGQILVNYPHNELVNTKDDVINVYSNQMKLVRSYFLSKKESYSPIFTNHEYIALDYIYHFVEKTVYTIEPVTLVNVNTGKMIEMDQNFPEMSSLIQVDSRFINITSFDPKLQLVYYPKDFGYVLWDIRNKKELADSQIGSYHLPIWSYDGSYAIIYSWAEINRIDREGNIRDLTLDIQDQYPEEIRLGDYPEISPNDEQIAIVLIAGDNPVVSRVFTLDVNTGKLTGYCENTNNIGNFLWSPDNRYLAMAVARKDHGWKTVIIDLKTNQRYELEGNLFPVGWLN